MKDWQKIEALCEIQDANKLIKLEAKTEDQIKSCEITEKHIQEDFKSLYVN